MDLLTFHVVAGLPPYQVNTEILLYFMEFLHLNHLAGNHIANYMADLRAFRIIYGLQTACFRDERVSLFLKFTKINAPLRPSVKSHIYISLLDSIIPQCDSLHHPEVLETIIFTMLLFHLAPFKHHASLQ